MKNCFKVINVENLKFNIEYIKNSLNKSTKICAVVKSDAYGHGSEVICDAIYNSVDYFAFGNYKEAIFIKEKYKNMPCMVLCPFNTYYLTQAIMNDIIFSIQSFDELKQLNQRAKELNKIALFHLQINTGMNRFGIKNENLKIFIELSKTLENVQICGVYSHLGAGEELGGARTKNQTADFVQAISILPHNVIKHLCNTQNTLCTTQPKLDMVRIGLGLYGYGDPMLKPVMSVYARIIAIQNIQKDGYIGYGMEHIAKRDMRVATVSIGYASGLPRIWGKHGYVLINNKKAKIVANICMEATIIDVSHIPAKIGDYVTILSDLRALNADKIAKSCKTIPYEILTNFRNVELK